jgi:hypothetical protein
VSLESSLEGISNGEGNLDLAQLGTKLWDFEIFPTWAGIGQTERNGTKRTFLGGTRQKKVFYPLELFPHFEPLGS